MHATDRQVLHEIIYIAISLVPHGTLKKGLSTFAGLLPLLSETLMQDQFLIPAAISLGYGIIFARLTTRIPMPCLLMIQTTSAAASLVHFRS